MQQLLQEYSDSRGVTLRVDRAAGVIRGVKLLGLQSQNGRSYLPQAVAAAVPLYEGAKVNVNHPKGSPLAPRDYQDRIGVIHGAQVRDGEGLFGDLHFNPKHALAEQLAWDAQHAPENVGFSHNVQARTSRQGDRVVVEAILRVQSVDLVADPATTRGLFEAASPSPPSDFPADAGGGEPPSNPPATNLVEHLAELRAENVRLQAELENVRGQSSALRAQLDELRLAEALAGKRRTAERLLAEFRLPPPDAEEPWAKAVVGATFFESLLAAADDAEMRHLVGERARLVAAAARAPGAAHASAVSRDQHLVEAAWSTEIDAAEFARAIRG